MYCEHQRQDIFTHKSHFTALRTSLPLKIMPISIIIISPDQAIFSPSSLPHKRTAGVLSSLQVVLEYVVVGLITRANT